ncbi:ribbon-helix-helix domain-containing protein [Acidianus brierleyi]|uniref:CopG family transcriptional regulator n=1 Tax=Acidianus brierleyi TaxID=41673 RepID=A0A2U9IIQ3_9CREN|nr:ribbon-helix-helix domain-containing protein [Acidianus brierleyi]AWR95922.1 ribbon-helix-helix protein, CopG family [Acidianus brierleyi]
MDSVKKVGEGTYELELNSTVTISFKLEDELLGKVDDMVRRLGYTNRSDFIREAIIEYIKYNKNKGTK